MVTLLWKDQSTSNFIYHKKFIIINFLSAQVLPEVDDLIQGKGGRPNRAHHQCYDDCIITSKWAEFFIFSKNKIVEEKNLKNAGP